MKQKKTYKFLINMHTIIHKNLTIRSMMLAILLIISVFILSACSLSSQQDQYHTGTTGLELTFFSANSNSVYEGEMFGNALTITNKGSADITPNNPAILSIIYDDYRLQGLKNQATNSPDPTQPLNIVSLHSRNSYYPQGDQIYVPYYFNARQLTELRESSDTTISYNLCYPYYTTFTTFTCIDASSTTSNPGPGVCTATPYDGSMGQGAPIVITKIVPKMVLAGGYILPQFDISVQNEGKGYTASAPNCTGQDMNNANNIGKLEIEASLSGTPLSCGARYDNTNSNIINLVSGSGEITCYLTSSNILQNQKNFLSPLTINITYSYIDTYSQKITIKSNPAIVHNGVGQTANSCSQYQIADSSGNCVDKCSYCGQNPQDPACNFPSPQGVSSNNFVFNANFSCGCDATTCDINTQNGNCITQSGYCPGGLYCCATTKCNAYQVLYNGRCIDKCSYCANINSSDTTNCAESFNFTGFACTKLTGSQCDSYASQASACIRTYCPASDEYCANIALLNSKNNALNNNGT